MNASHVEIHFDGKVYQEAAGLRVDQFLRQLLGAVPERVLAALVNRRQVMLDFPLRGRVELGLVRYGDREGESIYKRSVSLMLYEACRECFPNASLEIGQSLGNSYHFRVLGEHPDLDLMAEALEERMRALHEEQRPFVRQTVTIEELEAHFRAQGWQDKLELLATLRVSTLHIVGCGAFVDIAHGPFAPHTGCLGTFGVVPYEDGLLLRFPRRSNPDQLPPFAPRPLLYRIYAETRRWQELLGVGCVGQLNRLCLEGALADLIHVAEGLHEKKIASIADEIRRRGPGLRLVTIAGPSASGKTTFAKRLGIQLQVNGIEPLALSLDDYYIDRERTPLDEEGRHDFEALEAIDLPLFHRHLAELLAGREVRTPRYDFVSGTRRPESDWHHMRLAPGQVLLVEGIHGLNDRLTASVPRSAIYRIFISALSQLAIDRHNRIFTADARLIRRIVRDHRSRGFDADRTLDMWERVRRGEARWIFPFQEQADVMFNSALLYEPAVLKIYAERYLLRVPRTSPTYTEAYRLLKFLSLFAPIFPDEIPPTSILREFIGGSTFSY